MSKFLVSGSMDILNDLCEAVGVPAELVRRVVLDLEVGSPGRLYVDTFADDEKIRVALGGGITLTEEKT